VLRILAILFVIPLTVLPAQSQTLPAIGTIDYYGLRHVQKVAVERALQIKPGDKVTQSRHAAEARLEAVPGVARARLNFVCCDAAGKAILYVGIEEKGVSELHFRTAPNGDAELPEDIVKAGHDFEGALMKAVEGGKTGEDDSQGSSLSDAPQLRAIEERYVTFARHDLAILREVLHHSSEANQRALAAGGLGYAPDHRAVVPDLTFAMSDPSSNVRNNAMRALTIIAKYAAAHPSEGIDIPARPFIALLNSLVWTDRNKAGFALMALTQGRNPALLAQLREQALPSLVEMARWKNPGHALIYCVILGRIAGLPGREIWSDFQHGEKDKIIAAANGAAVSSRAGAGSSYPPGPSLEMY
jgi:hypothetical protein